jgi:hypothetical protein
MRHDRAFEGGGMRGNTPWASGAKIHDGASPYMIIILSTAFANEAVFPQHFKLTINKDIISKYGSEAGLYSR